MSCERPSAAIERELVLKKSKVGLLGETDLVLSI